MIFKVIVNGAVLPANSLPAVAARLVEARQAAASFRARAVPGFPARMTERDLTRDEFAEVVAIASRLVIEGSWRGTL